MMISPGSPARSPVAQASGLHLGVPPGILYRSARYNSAMKARVYVSLKPTVLDPQGQTIHSALRGLGHQSISGVRQGKYFEIELRPGAAREDANREMDQIARDVLSNPVMEDYRVEFID